MKKFIAFTLAETLIVIGIIGVIATLTMPNLNSSTSDKEKIAKLKKIYNDLEQAYGSAVAEYGPFRTWFNDDSCPQDKGGISANSACTKRLSDRIIKFMRVSKACELNTGCFTSGYAKLLNGANSSDNYETAYGYKYVLVDGTSLYLTYVSKSFAVTDQAGTPYGMNIAVDLDGSRKGTFTMGKDVFGFILTSNGITPRGRNFTDAQIKSICFAQGESCADWVIQNDSMDYLKADRTGKCPNGTQLSINQTTCK